MIMKTNPRIAEGRCLSHGGGNEPHETPSSWKAMRGRIALQKRFARKTTLPIPRWKHAFKQMPHRVVLVSLVLSILTGTAAAQNIERITEREIERRHTALSRAHEDLARAQAAMAEKNFAAAHEEFRNAVALMPDAVVSESAYGQAINGFCESGVKLAEQHIASGEYSAAEFLLREVLGPRYDPN